MEAMADISEGHCTLCRVSLITHDRRACCPCGGCSYRVNAGGIEMLTCPVHPPVRCEHWEAVWALMSPRDDLPERHP
jgi:hypothetical protein